MKGAKVVKISLTDFGGYLGMEKGCFTVRNKKGETRRYPLFESEIGEVVLRSGNTVSVGALACLGFWDIDTLIVSGSGKPVAMLRNLDSDAHVQTRIAQFKAIENGKGEDIAKKLVIAKAEGYDNVLRKFGLKLIGYVRDDVNSIKADDETTLRRKLMSYESKYSKKYFSQIFQLFEEQIRPDSRKTFRAYDGLNNLFNLAYELLKWKVHAAILKSQLEPFLGFLHSQQYAKPSLVNDFQELYRYIVDNFVIEYCRNVRAKDFVYKTEKHANKRGKRQYLNDFKTRDFTERLKAYFRSYVEIPRIKVGKKQELESLINEEAFLFAKYLRGEKTNWEPRIAELR